MSGIALVGGMTVWLRPKTLEKWLLPLVAFAAGSLIGGALFHMLPASIDERGDDLAPWIAVAAGFVAFFCLEQFLSWHHCHRPSHDHGAPITWLILLADGLHNFIGGLSIGAVFLADVRLGITAWAAAAAHEVPQELGDFGILIHGGWSRRRALVYNLASGLTFPAGMLLAWGASSELDVSLLVPFGAGNFLYIGCADLVPEVKSAATLGRAARHLACLLLGLGLLLALRLLEPALAGH